jgi:hypothetical protein
MLVGTKPKFLVAVWTLVFFILIFKANMLKMKKNYTMVNYHSILDVVVVVEVPHDKQQLCNLLQCFICCLKVGQSQMIKD